MGTVIQMEWYFGGVIPVLREVVVLTLGDWSLGEVIQSVD